MIPFLVISFINEEDSGCISEETIRTIKETVIGAIIPPRNPTSYFFISCFTVSVAPSVNRLDFSINSAIGF